MNRIKVLQSFIVLLLVINVVLLALFFFRGGRPKPPLNDADAKAKILQHFKFDADQMAAFEQSKTTHRAAYRELDKELTQLGKAYYLSSDDVQTKQTMLDSILVVTQQIYQANDQHMREIRAICKPDQLPKMDRFIANLMRQTLGKRPKE